MRLCYFHLGELGRVGNGSQSEIEQRGVWGDIVFVRDAGVVVAFVISGSFEGLAMEIKVNRRIWGSAVNGIRGLEYKE